RQMMGVEPLQPGIAIFQTTFSSVVHLTGRFFSLLTPLSAGPRHCGQFCAWATRVANMRATAARVSLCIHPPIGPQITQIISVDYSARRAGSSGERSAAKVATRDAIAPESRTASN